MNKTMVLAAGVMTLIAGFVEASSCGVSAASCDKASAAVVISTDEASFVSKLSNEHAIAFNLMSADQRLEVVALAHKENHTPDIALQNFLSQHHLAVVDGTLKSTNAQ